MTQPRAAEPMTERRTPSKAARVIGTVLAVLVAAAIVAYPAGIALLFVVVQWTGCFIECSEPNRLGAVASGAVGLVLLSIPVFVGIASWRGSSRRLLVAFGALALLAASLFGVQVVL